MITPQMSSLVNKVIKKHGAVIDLKKNPEILVEIIRGLGVGIAVAEPTDGGAPCAGTPPPPPPPPPSPSSVGDRVTNEQILQQVLKLARDFGELQKRLPTIKP